MSRMEARASCAAIADFHTRDARLCTAVRTNMSAHCPNPAKSLPESGVHLEAVRRESRVVPSRGGASVALRKERGHMLIGEIDALDVSVEHPELVGKRVLVTGAGSRLAGEIVQAFSSARTRLVLHDAGSKDGLARVSRAARRHAMDVEVLSQAGLDYAASLDLVRGGIQRFGGIDAVVNIADLDDIPAARDVRDDGAIADVLALPCLVTRVAVNRMRATLNRGSIVNILTGDRNRCARRDLVSDMVKCSLSAMTRTQARACAADGIRVNALCAMRDVTGDLSGSSGYSFSGEADVASLALHLASPRGHNLSGLTFEGYAG